MLTSQTTELTSAVNSVGKGMGAPTYSPGETKTCRSRLVEKAPTQYCLRACASHRLVRNTRSQPRLEQPWAPRPGGLVARAARTARLLPSRASLPLRAACDLPACGAMLPAAASRCLWGPRLGLGGAALRLARYSGGLERHYRGGGQEVRSEGRGDGRIATFRGPVCGAWRGRLGLGDLGCRYLSSPTSRR